MEVKQAVALAKSYFADVFAEEQIADLGLEEVQYDEPKDEWIITIGFNRNWSKEKEMAKAWLGPALRRERIYKTVHIADADGKVLRMMHREISHS